MSNKKLPVRPPEQGQIKTGGNTPMTPEHMAEHLARVQDHTMQTKTYGGHVGIFDPGGQGAGYSSEGGFPGGQGSAGTGDYSTNSVNDTPDADAGPDGPVS